MTTSAPNTEVGTKIAEWRYARRLSHTAVASLLGISKHRLWTWETKGIPKHDVVLATRAIRNLEEELDAQAVRF